MLLFLLMTLSPRLLWLLVLCVLLSLGLQARLANQPPSYLLRFNPLGGVTHCWYVPEWHLDGAFVRAGWLVVRADAVVQEVGDLGLTAEMCVGRVAVVR